MGGKNYEGGWGGVKFFKEIRERGAIFCALLPFFTYVCIVCGEN